MLKVNVCASQGAGPVNEDAAGRCGNAVWVIDGATGLGDPLADAVSDAAWFARRVDLALGDILHDRPATSTPDLLRETIALCRTGFEQAAQRLPSDAADLPSAAFAMVRQIDDSIEVTTLGDCRVAYRGADGLARLFGGTALAPFEARSIALADALRRADPAIDSAGLKQALRPHLRETRRLMNQPGGYWILGFDPAAVDHIDCMVVQPKAGDSFALASDGFLRLVEIFGMVSIDDLLAMSTPEAFDAQLLRLRAIEGEASSLTAYPRIKRHDDVSFVHCDYRVEG